MHAAAEGDWLMRATLPHARSVLRSRTPGVLRRWGAASMVVVSLGWCGLAAAESSRSINEWLSRMHEASRQRAYVGTLVVSAGPAMSASRIWHVCDGTQQMERVETLTGAPRTTIRRNSEVITFDTEARVAWTEKRESLGLFPELLRTPSNVIPDHYTVSEQPPERVAGHVSDVIELRPKDKLRFAYRIWAEKKTGLVMKLQTLDEHSQVLEQVAFTELQLDAPVRMDKLRKQMTDTRGYEVLKPSLRKTTAEAEGWRLREPVPGFQSMGCHVRDGEGLEAGSAPMQWVFSDGLASVSLFVEPYDPARHTAQGQAATGATHSLTRRIGDFWLTAMGEVPTSTLKRFAQSLERAR
ncbi:MAG: MucB/RseB C-terminal domain-containing protein [Gammaproteobacteria bacterium]